MHIAVIDSGIGGFSVVEHIQKYLPSLNITYLMDNAYLPYGEKSAMQIEDRLTYLISKHHSIRPFDAIVIACNTASTQVLDQLRAKFPVPFIGVVPAIKPAALLSHKQSILLLATPATISGKYVDSLIEQNAPDCQVHKVASTELVHLAEMSIESAISLSDLDNALAGVHALIEDVDVIVLGCTHFPLVTNQIQRCFPNVILVDSGEAIAKRVTHIIGQGNPIVKEVSLSKGWLKAELTLPVSPNKKRAMKARFSIDQIKEY